MNKKTLLLLIISVFIFLGHPGSVYADRVVSACSECNSATETCHFNPSSSEIYCSPKSATPPPAGVDQNIKDAIGTVTPPSPVDPSPQAISGFLPKIINIIFYVGLLAAFIYIVYGGIKWITAGGDSKALAAARETIFNAVVGTVLLSVSFAVVSLFNGTFKIFTSTASTNHGLYICGSCPAGMDKQLCYSIHASKCNNPSQTLTDDQFNNISPATRPSLCFSQGECNAGCQRNEERRLAGDPNPYRECRPL